MKRYPATVFQFPRSALHHVAVYWLWELSPEDGAGKQLREYSVSLVYATLGPKGCYAATEKHRITVNSPSGIRVVDTTGAGDIFGGSAMSQILKINKNSSLGSCGSRLLFLSCQQISNNSCFTC